MKKTTLINAHISSLVANLGHTDKICIADAGLPIPTNVTKIDLAIKLGLPKFLDVLSTIATEAVFEVAIFATELQDFYPTLAKDVQKILGQKCTIKFIPHKEFKQQLLQTKGIIRTGENKWFHNVILQSGVTF